MRSAIQHPEVINAYLSTEVAQGRVRGPIEPGIAAVHINRFGVIPNNHQLGKWRMITDLSFPKGSSVNDGIDPSLCSLMYTSVDEPVRKGLECGKGSLMAKMDIRSAYRTIPVHPDNRHLLGMSWNDLSFVDAALPFGLRSAPKIFNAVADALQWIFEAAGIKASLHYLDDYLFIGAAGTQECQQALDIALGLCGILGMPVAVEKTEGPSAVITFLGIELDTMHGGDHPVTSCEAGATEADHPALGEQESVHKAGSAVANWPTSTCMRGCQAREILPETDDRTVHYTERTAPPCAFECRIPIGPTVLGVFSAPLERGQHDGYP